MAIPVKFDRKLRETKVTINMPGANVDNTKIDTDTETNQVFVTCEDFELKSSFSVEERFDVNKTEAVIKDGIITITIPTKEGVVKSVTPK